MLASQQEIESRLAGGELCCPACGGSLSRWGFASPRVLRTRAGTRTLRLRRAACAPCRRTHVLLSAGCVARRRDSAEVIGAALLASAQGVGHRQIAADLARPPGTVRGWLRRARARSGPLRASATRWATALDVHPEPMRPQQDAFEDAVEALAVAARAWVLRFGPAEPWDVALHLTGGLLSGGSRRGPP